MDKLMEEEDLKGLEEEIDNAVDRLFVERKRTPEESLLMESPLAEPSLKPSTLEPSMGPPMFETPVKPHPLEPSLMEPPLAEPSLKPSTLEPSMRAPVFETPVKSHPLEPSLMEPPMKSAILERSVKTSLLEPSFEFEKSLDGEDALPPPPAHSPAPVPTPFLKAMERMEAQLLSLEWEITEEKLEKAREEILALKTLLKQKPETTSILGRMENVLTHMIENEETIRPPWIKFLLDSKETIKLLMRKEAGAEINTYKQLAYLGIEARFSCLEGMSDAKISQASLREGEVQPAGLSVTGEKKIGEMSKSMHLFMKRVEEIFGTLQQQIIKLEATSRKQPSTPIETSSPTIHVTVFKIDERLFGIESEKVFKLFKVPKTFEEKYSDQQKIRVKEFEVRMIDLKKRLAIQEAGPKEQIRILMIKEDGEYKGLMVDEVLKRVSILSERKGGAGGFFSGVIPFTYQEQRVDIPILDLKKF